ncbi:OmpA family protein [Paracrocinitomix mangrovi]|uniref:OmpA family protein n=1 Tax=Paracrocinitomix mangrovi TaxID=2862509 RepID=UPI001C8D4D0A|nr:OmpA family protein [Paracrocinitomix mangrovi]UKN01343.1 OmpA family protein [Paracrocinitomix mangrovi]
MKNLIAISLIAFGFTVFGQDVEWKAKNFEDKDGFKTAFEAYEKGKESWELGNQEVFATKDPELHYWKALEQFEKAFKFNPKSAELNFMMGVCYAHSSYKVKCTKYFETAYELNPEVHHFMNYYMGFARQLEYKFDEALKFYQKFENEYKKADRFGKFVKQRYKECQSGKTLHASPVRAWVDQVPEVSTEYNDYAPSITMDGSEMVLTSDRPNSHSPNEVGKYDDDIYTSTFENGKWSTPKPIKGNKINTEKDDISNNFSYNGTKLLLNQITPAGHFDIYESFQKGDEWTEPVSFSRNINLKSDDIYAAYNFNDKLIYYSKSSENNGYEIMVSGVVNVRTREWGLPNREMATSTTFNDGPVYLHPDGKTMYFASEGHNSMGGYDIFMSTKEKSGYWSKPVNMGYPINTPYDDFFFAATANGKFAYIASNREGGEGGFDIYKVTFWGPEKEPALATQDYLLASVAKPIQDPELASEVKVTTSANLTVFKGKTVDALTKKPVEAVIEIINNQTGESVENFTTNSASGKFLLSLNSGANYGIAVKADGYLFHSENFDIPEGSAYNLVNKTIELKNIKVGSKIALRNVFFDTGKSNLRPESNAELDRLVKLLKDVPSLKIELSGHTDNTGSAQGNITLSQDRADAVMAYLVGKGINKSRLTAKGYGSDKPVATNDSAEGRQLNRRTEFEITAN